jgi:ABC-type Zn2+ transport system substrate-binding protein/surface adhesin
MRGVQHEQHQHEHEHEHTHIHEAEEEGHGHGHGAEEPVVVKKMAPNEVLAKSLSAHGVVAEPVAVGTHPLEKREYYSHKFGLNSKFVTNRGIIKVKGRNFDLVQILQRN